MWKNVPSKISSYKFHWMYSGSWILRNIDCFKFKFYVTWFYRPESPIRISLFYQATPLNLNLIVTYSLLPVISLALLFAFSNSFVSLFLEWPWKVGPWYPWELQWPKLHLVFKMLIHHGLIQGKNDLFVCFSM